ncbi:hypothetical protein QBC34DRAFT_441962 [Podospora aff. communis PSN243]|uniref:Uncharacterized protein n=1 Tax=Podospora aff. communis PSN243 TaxID=3040156 RepID=A0AAV9G8D8_9PEZI|nr:hypothetical protein QBC34DRAFT_441962 [Podospora aff. communis PSN243]
MSTTKSKMPTGYKMADTSTLTPEEEQWVKDHWGSEHHFLQAYGLNIYKEEDREEGRAMTRGLMKQDVAKDRRWFRDYFALPTATVITTPHGDLKAVGRGRILFPVRRSKDSPRSNGVLHLFDAFHVPDAPFNIICPQLVDLYLRRCSRYFWPASGVSGELVNARGRAAAYCEKYPFYEVYVLILSYPPYGPRTGQSTLDAQSKETLPMRWPRSEQEKWYGDEGLDRILRQEHRVATIRFEVNKGRDWDDMDVDTNSASSYSSESIHSKTGGNKENYETSPAETILSRGNTSSARGPANDLFNLGTISGLQIAETRHEVREILCLRTRSTRK